MAINKKLNSLFHKYIERGNKKILELGCAKSKRLIYFAKEYGYNIYGVDYSEKGVEIAIENLKNAGVLGNILCEDMFKTTLNSEYFDIVYSMGLLEHFNIPEKVINVHTKLLKKNGILIITIPNFRGSIYFDLLKMRGKEKFILENHNLNIMNKKILNKILNDKNVSILKLDYFGPLDFSSVFIGIRFKPILYLLHIINQLLGYLTYYVPNSRYLSPYIVLVAKKLG